MYSLKRQWNVLKQIRHKLQDENFYWEVGYYALIIAGVVHFGFLLLFLYLKIYILAVVNIFSVLIYWYTIFGIGLRTLERRDDGMIGWLVYAELIGHNTIATYYLGIESGFVYYIYLFTVVPFFISTYRIQIYLFRIISALVVALYLDFSKQFRYGSIILEKDTVLWLERMNMVIALSILLILLIMYIRKEEHYHHMLMECDEVEDQKRSHASNGKKK